MIFLTITLISLLLVLLYIYFVWNFNYWIKRNVPGPKPRPYLGTFPGSAIQQKNITYEIDDIYKEYAGKVPYCGVFVNRSPQLLALDPQFTKDIFIRNFKNYQKNQLGEIVDKNVDRLFALNPFLLHGEEWKEKRSEITPAFTVNKMKAIYPIIEDVCKRMTQYIKQEEKCATDGIDAKELASKFTIDTVTNCIFGMDSKAFTDNDSLIRKMSTSLFKPSIRFFIGFTVATVFPFIKRFLNLAIIPRSTELYFETLMNDAIALRKSENIERDDFLGYLLQLQKRKNLNNLDMAAHTVAFFLDGYETSSIAIAHVLYALGKNVEVQEKLRNEINQTITKHGSITYDILNDMSYLDQVFHETLRINPPATFTVKICTDQIVTNYEDRKLLIEKDMSINIPIYSIHHDSRYYTDPERFYPERFDPDQGGVKKYRDAGVYIPFGDGPRICLGIRFGTLQVKSAIVEIIRKFNIAVNGKTKEPLVIEPKYFLNLPVGGIWIDFKSI